MDDDLTVYERLFRGTRSSWPGFQRAEGRLTVWNGPHYKSSRNAWVVKAVRQLGHDPQSSTHCSWRDGARYTGGLKGDSRRNLSRAKDRAKAQTDFTGKLFLQRRSFVSALLCCKNERINIVTKHGYGYHGYQNPITAHPQQFMFHFLKINTLYFLSVYSYV